MGKQREIKSYFDKPLKSCENPGSPGELFLVGFPLAMSVRFLQKKATPSQRLEQSWLRFLSRSVVLKKVLLILAGDPQQWLLWGRRQAVRSLRRSMKQLPSAGATSMTASDLTL